MTQVSFNEALDSHCKSPQRYRTVGAQQILGRVEGGEDLESGEDLGSSSGSATFWLCNCESITLFLKNSLSLQNRGTHDYFIGFL
jgi:hypothetical protein